jgi:general secretion pathway protein I
MPDVGDSTVACAQAGRDFVVNVSVRPTPNPSFRRVDAQVVEGDNAILRLSTIVGRY